MSTKSVTKSVRRLEHKAAKLARDSVKHAREIAVLVASVRLANRLRRIGRKCEVRTVWNVDTLT